MKFQKGDTVKINKQATIDDMSKNYWNGCQRDTLNFIERYANSDRYFKLNSDNLDDDYVEINVKEYDEVKRYLVNTNILKLVDKKEMTISEIEKALGYPIKVVKEREDN